MNLSEIHDFNFVLNVFSGAMLNIVQDSALLESIGSQTETVSLTPFLFSTVDEMIQCLKQCDILDNDVSNSIWCRGV